MNPSHPSPKDASLMIDPRELYVKVQTVKLLEENTGEYLHELGVGKDSLDRTQKALMVKGKIMNK